MASPLTDIMNTLNNKSSRLDDSFIEEHFVPFLTNTILSRFKDTIDYARDMNQADENFPKVMQYDFFYYGIRKRKRFAPWIKDVVDDDVELIMNHYNYSREKADEVLRIIEAENLEHIKSLYVDGRL